MTTYLQKQKKGDLQALASRAGLPGADSLLKEDLVSQLDAYLRQNSTTLSKDKAFTEFYERSASPVKKTKQPADGETKRRRTTSVKVEPESTDGASGATPATPAAVQSLASRIRLPPSPSGVSDVIEAQTTRLSNKINTYIRKSGIKKRRDLLRQDLSSIQVIQLLILIFEAVGLRSATLPWEHIGESPAFKPLGIKSYSVHAPNFFKVLTNDFWAPTTLWLTTSLFVPLLFAYFFNLTYTNPRPRSRKVAPLREYDPLTFSIVKGLLAYIVYNQGFTFWGAFELKTVSIVNTAVKGGYTSIVIGSLIGVLTSLYDNLSFKS